MRRSLTACTNASHSKGLREARPLIAHQWLAGPAAYPRAGDGARGGGREGAPAAGARATPRHPPTPPPPAPVRAFLPPYPHGAFRLSARPAERGHGVKGRRGEGPGSGSVRGANKAGHGEGGGRA